MKDQQERSEMCLEFRPKDAEAWEETAKQLEVALDMVKKERRNLRTMVAERGETIAAQAKHILGLEHNLAEWQKRGYPKQLEAAGLEMARALGKIDKALERFDSMNRRFRYSRYDTDGDANRVAQRVERLMTALEKLFSTVMPADWSRIEPEREDPNYEERPGDVDGGAHY